MATNEIKRFEEYPLESEFKQNHPLMSWRSTVAGLIISFFVMTGLIGLGMAFGGIGIDEDTSMASVGMFTGIWFLVSTVLSIFVGSYFAARVSKFQTGRIGSAQGIVIAALFLGAFLWQSFMAIGNLGQLTGSVIGKSVSGVNKISQNPYVSNFVGNLTQNAIGDLNLKAEPQVVANGIASRLIQGDTQGAKNYIAFQAGLSQEEANQRITQLKNQFDAGLIEAKQRAASALKSAGWSLFLLVILSTLSAVAGGGLGSVANHRKPLIVREYYGKEIHA
jgi:hypothetical protein